jgi:hypothetical protein
VVVLLDGLLFAARERGVVPDVAAHLVPEVRHALWSMTNRPPLISDADARIPTSTRLSAERMPGQPSEPDWHVKRRQIRRDELQVERHLHAEHRGAADGAGVAALEPAPLLHPRAQERPTRGRPPPLQFLGRPAGADCGDGVGDRGGVGVA